MKEEFYIDATKVDAVIRFVPIRRGDQFYAVDSNEGRLCHMNTPEECERYCEENDLSYIIESDYLN